MFELRTICVGIDVASESDTSLRSAVHLARPFGAKLVLVGVVHPPAVYQRILCPVQSKLVPEEALLARTIAQLQGISVGPDLKGLALATDVRLGVPFAELIAAARAWSADLLVIGAKQRRNLERVLLGGTAERVLRKAHVPVLIARSELPPSAKVILAPTDFSAASLPAIRYATGLAQRYDARLILLHVLEPIAQTYIWPADPAAVEFFLAEPEDLTPEWEDFLSGLDLANVRWEQRTVKGGAAATIAASAAELGADLIAMGTHGRSGLMHALLGSVAERVLRNATCPVLTVRPDRFEFAPP